jgi:hypothetical protein
MLCSLSQKLVPAVCIDDGREHRQCGQHALLGLILTARPVGCAYLEGTHERQPCKLGVVIGDPERA